MIHKYASLVARAVTGFLWLLCSCGLAVAEDSVQAEIRFTAASSEPAWVGQGVDLHLELWSEALSFSGQSWVLPEVPGAFLVQNESSALNMTERRQGTSWQGVRYTFQVYPQRPGTIVVPPFSVRFQTRKSYGSEPRAWSFETPRMELESRLPPGAAKDDLLLTTDDFSMKANWSLQLPEDGVLELSVGDALSLTVEREADGVPGMVFAPLNVPEIDGLGIYPDAPAVIDKSFRGTLVGNRRDVITFVCERAGTYQLPGQRFSWWDPVAEELNEAVLRALDLEVVEHPVWGTSAAGQDTTGEPSTRMNTFVFLGLLVIVAAVAWKAGKPLFAWFGRLRAEWMASEYRAFRQVRNCCRGGKASEAYASINTW